MSSAFVYHCLHFPFFVYFSSFIVLVECRDPEGGLPGRTFPGNVPLRRSAMHQPLLSRDNASIGFSRHERHIENTEKEYNWNLLRPPSSRNWNQTWTRSFLSSPLFSFLFFFTLDSQWTSLVECSDKHEASVGSLNIMLYAPLHRVINVRKVYKLEVG